MSLVDIPSEVAGNPHQGRNTHTRNSIPEKRRIATNSHIWEVIGFCQVLYLPNLQLNIAGVFSLNLTWVLKNK